MMRIHDKLPPTSTVPAIGITCINEAPARPERDGCRGTSASSRIAESFRPYCPTSGCAGRMLLRRGSHDYAPAGRGLSPGSVVLASTLFGEGGTERVA